MSARLKRRARALVFAAVGAGLACGPLVGEPGSAAPINSCPTYPCEAYQQPGAAPACSGGVCAVAAPTTSNLLLVIGLATDSYLAPGQTYIMVFGAEPIGTGSCQILNCSPPACHLPEWTRDTSGYVVAPTAAEQANWYVGPAVDTTLPVQATFRRVIPTSLDAFDVGLPVQPVLAENVPQDALLGPNGTPQVQFRTYLQPGCYERTLQPFAPLSKAFPPEIKLWPPDDSMAVTGFDVTHEETVPSGAASIVPTFDIGRAEGLAGWTAYLRNIQTRRIFSNVVPLTGSFVRQVQLLTNHVATPGDEALAGLELVLEAPADQPLPTEVFAPAGVPGSQELTSSVMYPSLPTPVTVSGRIRTAGAPVPADVYFTATDITDRSGQKFPPNFEFATHVSATTDPRTGESTYSVLLPQGHYQVAVRPTDASSAIVVAPMSAVGGEGNEMTGEDFEVRPLVAVSGSVAASDGRLLAQAIVEMVPTQCAPSFEVSGAPDPGGACLPRSASTQTALDGTFTLSVDPGQYLLRVRPRQGSKLPWKTQPLVVDTASRFVGRVVVPAPLDLGMQLTDSAGGKNVAVDNPVVNAVVRVFTYPTQTAPAVQLGEAITDGSGNYEMYIAPPDQ